MHPKIFPAMWYRYLDLQNGVFFVHKNPFPCEGAVSRSDGGVGSVRLIMLRVAASRKPTIWRTV
ncbi:MAG: hypothetical protein D6746_13610 [Bacteroidetes bacterium]|nr:MAG: hypothetical protein D6746_13610 [Bacteroidota bacterium]